MPAMTASSISSVARVEGIELDLIASNTLPASESQLRQDADDSDAATLHSSIAQPASEVQSQAGLISASASASAAASISAGEEILSTQTGDNLAPVDGGKGAWLYLLGAVLTEALSFGIAYSQGTFLAYHQTNPASPFHHASPSALSAVGSIMTGATFAMPYLAHGFFQANPRLVRKIYAGVTVCSTLAVLAASFLPDGAAVGLIILQGVIPGICGGLAFLPAQMWLSQWFDKRRGAAASVMYLGSGVGGVIFPLLLDAFLKATNFRWTLRAQGVIQLVGGLTALHIMHPRLPSAVSSISPFARSQWRRYIPGSWRPLLCVSGTVGGVITLLQAAAWTAISLYLSTLCISIGLSERTANGVLSAYNGSAVLSFMIVAAVVDRLSTGTLMAISTAGCGLAAYLLLGFASTLGVVLPFVLLFGVLGAGFSTFVVTMARTIVERYTVGADFTQVSCIYILIRGLGATAGPLVASVLYDVNKAGEADLWGGHGMQRLVIFSGSVMSGVAAISFGFRQQLRVK
ncbi:hypothetical protein OC834_000457 [Tilletia horrida]|nr:hypothetical protein OC835_006642 [Tilletia horrida]KAK0538389.1 hypothetical protein OC834_000457 [Tilletia horrida]